jgi:hypothetical protein
VMISVAFPNTILSTSTIVASLCPAAAITSPHSAPSPSPTVACEHGMDAWHQGRRLLSLQGNDMAAVGSV